MRSIGFKLWVGMISLVIVMLVILWFFQIVFLESFYLKQQISTVKNEGTLIAEEWYGIGSKEELEARLEKLVYDYKSSVSIYDSKGKLVYSTEYEFGHSMGRGPMMRYGSLQTGILKDVLEGNVVNVPDVHPKFRSELRIIGIPVKNNGNVEGALIISMPVAPVEEIAEALKNQLVLITVLLLGAALIISFIMSRLFTRPILDIDRAAAEMASGNLDVRLKLRSRDELGRLTNTMNHLAVKLSGIEQLRKELIANVSHELRTPLSLIRGYAETIRDVSGENRDKRDKQLEIIIEESERLSRIVDDILNLSQMQSGYVKLDVNKFNLSNTIENVVKRYDILREKSKVKIRVNAGDNLFVNADESRIEQVLYNIINNAFNHTSDGDTISVDVGEFDNKVRVKVSDTGKGIPEEELKDIWERYHKGGKPAGRRQAGIGLGLAIVKSILEMHKSNFGVESEVGKGTTFWFELGKCNRAYRLQR